MRARIRSLVDVTVVTLMLSSTTHLTCADEPPAAPSWLALPIALRGQQAPGGGTFEEYGTVDVFDSGAIAFWARFGEEVSMFRQGDPGAKSNWGLYWYDDRGLRWLLSSNHDARDDVGEFKVPKHMRFVGAPQAHLLSSWWGLQRFDRTTFHRIVYRGGSIDLGGEEYEVKWGLRSLPQPYGAPIVEFKAGKPVKGQVWFRATNPPSLAWKEGQAIPGLPGASLKSVLSVIDFPGASLVGVKLKGAPFSGALLRWAPDGAEVLFDESQPDPSGRDLWIRQIWAADPNTVAIATNWRGSLSTAWGGSSRLFLHHVGETKLVLRDQSQLREADDFNIVSIGDVVFAPDGSGRFLATVRLIQANLTRKTPWIMPDLIWYDGERLNTVPWERAIGESFTDLKELSRSRSEADFLLQLPIAIRPAIRQPGMIVIELPPGGSPIANRRLALFDTARPEAGLLEPPALETDHGPISSALVVGQSAAGRLVVASQKGIYVLSPTDTP